MDNYSSSKFRIQLPNIIHSQYGLGALDNQHHLPRFTQPNIIHSQSRLLRAHDNQHQLPQFTQPNIILGQSGAHDNQQQHTKFTKTNIIHSQSRFLGAHDNQHQLPQFTQTNNNQLISSKNEPITIPSLSYVLAKSSNYRYQYHHMADISNDFIDFPPYLDRPSSSTASERKINTQPDIDEISMPKSNPPTAGSNSASIHSDISEEDQTNNTNVKLLPNGVSRVRQYKKWSESENNMLVSLVKELNRPRWIKLTSFFEGRNHDQLKMQYRRLMKKHNMNMKDEN